MRRFAILSFILLIAFQVFADQANSDKIKAARKAADSWLQLIDTGQYDKSWDTAASAFQAFTTKDKWIEAMKAANKQLGRTEFHRFDSANYTTTVPNAPPGEYVILTYKAKYASLPNAIETVTVVLDKDGKWHVTGYYVKNPS